MNSFIAAAAARMLSVITDGASSKPAAKASSAGGIAADLIAVLVVVTNGKPLSLLTRSVGRPFNHFHRGYDFFETRSFAENHGRHVCIVARKRIDHCCCRHECK